MTKQSIRIAIVAFSAPPYSAGGVASAHYNLFKALQGRGFEAKLFTFGDREHGEDDGIVRRGGPGWYAAACHRLNGVAAAGLGGKKVIYQVRDILASQWGARRMDKAIREFNPQVVLLSDHGAPGLALRRRADTGVILISHHNPARFQDSNFFPIYSDRDARLAVWLENRVMHKVDLVVCPSNYMAGWFRRTYRFSGPLRIIPNVLDGGTIDGIPALDIRPKMGLDASVPLIYLPSAGSRMKGAEFVPELVRSMNDQTHGEIGFYIPGEADGGLRTALEKISGKARVYLPGHVEYRTHIAVVKACSFGIAPSLLENYSMALLEAVYCGVPMLAFESGGNPDIIQAGKNGFLAPIGEIGQLISMAKSLLDPARLNGLRQRTVKYSQEHLSPQRATDGYVEAIEWLSRA